MTDSSRTIVDCLVNSARKADVDLRVGNGVKRAIRDGKGGFELVLENEEPAYSRRLMLATGGCRAASAGRLAVALGHELEPPVPSLFAFQTSDRRLKELAGISMESVDVTLEGLRLSAR